MNIWDYIKAIAVIVLLIFAAYYLTRKFAKNGGGIFRKCPDLKLIGMLSLGKDKGIAVVGVGKHAYVLGVSGQSVERLDKIELTELNLEEEPSAPPDFTDCFKNELSARLKKLYHADSDQRNK